MTDLSTTRAEVLTRAATAARELCELLWDGLHQELHDPDERRIRELSERLAAVSSTVGLLAGTPAGQAAPSGSPTQGTQPQPLTPERRTPPEPIWGEPRPQSEPSGPPPPPPTPHPAAAAARLAETAARLAEAAEPVRMRLVDEHEQHSEQPSATATLRPASEPAPRRASGTDVNTDVRPEQGASAWVNTVGRLLARHAVDGLPFAVLLVELVDIARIEHSEPPAEVTRLVSQVEAAMAQAMRAEDDLSRESLGRYWLAAPHTNGTGARMLAERLVRLVRGSASHRGVALEVAIGIAVCPEDGCEAPELAARADLSVYSARATGRAVARAEPPA